MGKMIVFFTTLLLVSCFESSWALLPGNLTMPEMALDFSATNYDESESELSSQLQEIDERSSGWSSWSQWSACSRSCDGGVSHQLRTCKNGPCRGEHVRYKICNMQSFVAFFAFLAVASAGVLVAPSARIIQGPSSRTTVVGPDGSAISSVAPAGQIVQEESVGVVAHSAPVLAAAPAIAYSAPAALAYSAHSVYGHAPVVSAYHAAPVVSAYSAPVVSAYSGVLGHSTVDTVVSGPSGTIATGKTVAAAPVIAAF